MLHLCQDGAKTNILLLICAIKGGTHLDVILGDCASILPCSCSSKLSPVISVKFEKTLDVNDAGDMNFGYVCGAVCM